MPKKKPSASASASATTSATTPENNPGAWVLRAPDWTGDAEAIRADGLIVDVRERGAQLTLKSPLGDVVPLTLKDVAGLEAWLGGPFEPLFPPDISTPCFYIPAKYYTSSAQLRAKLDRLMPAPLRVWVAGRAWGA